MKYYKTKDNFPIKSNNPMPDWTEISEQEYKQICKERNDQIAVNQATQEEKMRSIIERRKLIMQRALKNAEKELIDEGTING